MADKERLEEMEELLNVYYENIDDPFAITDIAMAIVGKVGYFVNRVQELENEYQIRQEYLEEHIDRLEKENKRYREAIERALGESGWGDEGNALYRTIGILTKTLEESK